jgi:uncharacterized protein (TIGR01319 family)
MTNDIYLLVDFGSTYTKVLAVDMDKEVIAGRSQSPSTVQKNMLSGLQDALKKLTIHGHKIDDVTIKRSKKLASSSAAGGLCIVAVGLVPDLTLDAARKAALGAGAKVVGSYAYEIDEETVKTIELSGCDIVLLVGGIDGGNKDIILHNATMLAASTLNVPFVVAGNKVVANRVKEILESSGKYVEKTQNVLPELDRLDVEPARSCIRDIFMRRIVHAKGLDKAQEYIGDILMPTPMATLKAAALLAGGHKDEIGLGELMVVEVGGATTNIHSVAAGYSTESTTVFKGVPEPYEKRTVEGDLGIRYNAATILSLVGAKRVLANACMNEELSELDVASVLNSILSNVSYIPQNAKDLAVDVGLAGSAVEIAVERHVGTIRESWGPNGEIRVQHGKDLTELGTVIGTGGVFAYNPHPERILRASLMTTKAPFSLKPKAPQIGRASCRERVFRAV